MSKTLSTLIAGVIGHCQTQNSSLYNGNNQFVTSKSGSSKHSGSYPRPMPGR